MAVKQCCGERVFAFALLLTGVSVVLLVGASLLRPAPSAEQLDGLTYATTMVEDRERSRASWDLRDAVLSVIVLIVLAAIVVYFSPLGVGG